jgi:serine/threonine-protein kinase HipA
MMQLARAVGIDVPETQLVELESIIGLPRINLPHERYAYAIRRFDRNENRERIHCEDFAQIFSVRSDRKYNATNYDSMAKLIYELFPGAWAQTEELIRRLVFNLLIGNSDAHLQNFAVIYRDQKKPQLAPSYDLVSTLPYVGDRELALNFAKQKNFYAVNEDTLRYFAKRAGISENLVLQTAMAVVDAASRYWPKLLKELPLGKPMIAALRLHWKKLKPPFTLLGPSMDT